MSHKSDAAKILEWAESLELTNPELWEQLIIKHMYRQGTSSKPVMSRESAMEQIVSIRVASCRPHKGDIPDQIQWRGRESASTTKTASAATCWVPAGRCAT